jgi:pimeloyl-ACP methyl ester carboxylesterase
MLIFKSFFIFIVTVILAVSPAYNYYRALKDDAAFVKTFHGKKLTMPVLTISGGHGVGDKFPNALKSETSSLESIIVENSGHFVSEETPKIFNSAVIKFIENSKA